LSKKMGLLRRPVRITFEKPDPAAADFRAQASGGSSVEAALDLSLPRLRAVFRQFDADHSGDLDTFELASAVEALLGQPPSANQVTAFLRGAGSRASAHNALSLPQFCYSVRTFDWADDAGGFGGTGGGGDDWGTVGGLGTVGTGGGGGEGSGDGEGKLYALSFPKPSLGFKVTHDAARGRIVVGALTDAALAGVVAPGDVVVTVNGAPLGRVTDSELLQTKVGPLRRPVRIGFLRGGGGSRSTVGGQVTTDRDLSAARIAQVFAQHGRAGSGDLDTFELASAVEALTGRAPSTHQVTAWAVQAAHDAAAGAENALSLAAFTRLVRGLGTSAGQARRPAPRLASGLFELSFPKANLGFAATARLDRGTMHVSTVRKVLIVWRFFSICAFRRSFFFLKTSAHLSPKTSLETLGRLCYHPTPSLELHTLRLKTALDASDLCVAVAACTGKRPRVARRPVRA
jgi:hypothetical protein